MGILPMFPSLGGTPMPHLADNFRTCTGFPPPLDLPVLFAGLFPRCGQAVVAQLVEHVLGKDEVMGSSPINSSFEER